MILSYGTILQRGGNIFLQITTSGKENERTNTRQKPRHVTPGKQRWYFATNADCMQFL